MTKRQQVFRLAEDVVHLIDDSFLAGAPMSSADRYQERIDDLRVDIEGVRRLQEETIRRYTAGDIEMDAWLAPRVHNLLRVTRRQARDQGFWRWMALAVTNDYVRHRWALRGKVKAYRYLGGSFFLRRNAIARLWWGAEILRNGSDYGAVAAISESAVEQYVLDSRFGNLRASALGFARVVLDSSNAGRPLLFEEAKDLSKRANLLLSATALESLGLPAAEEIGDSDEAWFEDEPDVELLIKKKLTDLKGPADGASSDEEVRSYERWYDDIVKDMSLGKKSRAAEASQ